MTGKDLFASLNFVDDELIEEAESYAPARILPMRAIRRAGALAACVCLIVCLAVLVRSGVFLSGSAAPESMMDASKEMYQEDACVTEEAVEEETAAGEAAPAEMEEAVEKIEDTAESEMADGAPEAERPAEDAAYYIINEADSPEGDTMISQPENGEWACEFGLRKQIMDVLRMQITPSIAGGTGKEARFLAAFRLIKDGKPVDPDSAEYLEEVQRLTELGYEFRALRRDGRRKESKVLICGLFTAEQLDEFSAREFDASTEYGYIFYFPENKDGTPLDWEDYDELCGLPLAENVEE